MGLAQASHGPESDLPGPGLGLLDPGVGLSGPGSGLMGGGDVQMDERVSYYVLCLCIIDCVFVMRFVSLF